MARQTVYVDIVQRRPFSESRKKRQASPLSVSTPATLGPPSSDSSPRKKQKLRAHWEQDEFESSATCVESLSNKGKGRAQRMSPTLSNFEHDDGRDGLQLSPTLSSFEPSTSPTVSTMEWGISVDEVDDDEASEDDHGQRQPATRSHNSIPPTKAPKAHRQSAPGSSKQNRPSVLSPSPSSSRPPSSHERYEATPLIYEVMDDELQEDEDLAIPGETPLEDYDSDEEGDIPIRLLNDFTVYDMESNEMVPIGQLLELKYSPALFGASGIARPWTKDLDDEDEDEENEESDSTLVTQRERGQRMKLSKILELDIHHFSEETKRLDSKIYLRTKFAWYILDIPASTYQSFFKQFWTHHRLFHLMVMTALDAPRTTYDSFIDSIDSSHGNIEEEDVANALDILGRPFKKKDFETDDMTAYILCMLADLSAQSGITIQRVPLIKTIVGSMSLEIADKPTPRVSKREKKNKVTESRTVHQVSKVTFTPIVDRIGRDLFKGYEVVGTTDFHEKDEGIAAQIGNIQDHHYDPTSMHWGKKILENRYRSITMDGIKYKVGDDVMVNPGVDEHTARAKNAESESAQSVNSYGNRLWFCRIQYFFEEVDPKTKKPIKMFHGQWYVHGSKTILQETAHSKSLYWTNECGNNPAASIIKKCNIKMLSFHDEEVPDDRAPDSNDFHCGLVYNDKKADFTDLPSLEQQNDILACLSDDEKCYSCGLAQKEFYLSNVHPLTGGISHHGIDYHVSDFVYIRPNEPIGLLRIAQITDIDDKDYPRITVVFFDRYDDFVLKQKEKTPGLQLISDERRLYITEVGEIIFADKLDGICYVQYLEDADEIEHWVRHNDHYYFNQEGNQRKLKPFKESDFDYCHLCYNERIARLERVQKLVEKNDPLRGLELFSGAGGLGTGMNMSGFVESKYAVEFSPAAAQTYAYNHPDTTVYCQDTNVLLAHAIAVSEGKKPPALKSLDGKVLPAMPRRGEVDVIYGGPPCQSFSRANHTPRADDARSSLPGNMLSYLEYYSADYFLLENVEGLLTYPLMSTQTGHTLEGGIQAGVVKFIMRTLIALGYQVRYGLLQAAQYGAPQGRNRVIFLAAKRGLPLPEYPVPVYAFPRGAHWSSLPTGDRLPPVSRGRAPGSSHQCAPLKFVTVNDSIGDLPPFEWKNPHRIIPAGARDRAEAQMRAQTLGIPAFNATTEEEKGSANPGYPGGAVYAMAPQNRYQQWIRQGMVDVGKRGKGKGKEGTEGKVTGHYTKRFKANQVESTTAVPLHGNADHKDLPISLQPNHAQPGRKSERYSYYGRLEGNGYFKCAMTNVAPCLKNSWTLHPTQKRILSVRECARAQGFPDHYVFQSLSKVPGIIVSDQIRQIGNAVPVPLALALGKAVGEALVKTWEEKERQGSPAV